VNSQIAKVKKAQPHLENIALMLLQLFCFATPGAETQYGYGTAAEGIVTSPARLPFIGFRHNHR
jgi:hypothetical protein